MFNKNIIYYFAEMDIFNFIRGIALLCVVGLHTVCVVNPIYPEIHYSKLFHTPAWMSMWIFFFLSGYLLGKGFYTGKYKTNAFGILWFYISRLIRIIPMYLLFILILFIFYNPIWFITNPITTIKLLTFTYNGNPNIIGVGALWFVSTIVQLYIIAPFMYKFILSKFNEKTYKTIISAIIIIVILGLSYRLILNLFKLPYYNYCYTSSIANSDLFFGGMVLNALTIKSKENMLKKWLRPISLISLFTLIILYIYNVYSLWMYSWICPTLTLISLLLIVYSFDSCNKIPPTKLTFKKILLNPLRFIEYLGIISFTFYLYHSNFIEISMKILKNTNFPYIISNIHLYRYTFILMFIITFVFSVVMHYILEKPCNDLRNSLLEYIKE